MLSFLQLVGKLFIDELNKRNNIYGWNISNFYNIKQFHYIETKEIDSKRFYIIALPEDNEGNSLLEIKFLVSLLTFIEIIPIFGCYYEDIMLSNKQYICFTKFIKLTGNFQNKKELDYWLIRNKKIKNIKKCLKSGKNNLNYNLAMYELFGFNEEYVRKNLIYIIK